LKLKIWKSRGLPRSVTVKSGFERSPTARPLESFTTTSICTTRVWERMVGTDPETGGGGRNCAGISGRTDSAAKNGHSDSCTPESHECPTCLLQTTCQYTAYLRSNKTVERDQRDVLLLPLVFHVIGWPAGLIHLRGSSPAARNSGIAISGTGPAVLVGPRGDPYCSVLGAPTRKLGPMNVGCGQAFAAQIAGQHQRPVKECLHVGIVGHAFRAQVHGSSISILSPAFQVRFRAR